ncbi:MAG TPA: sigma-70 family RNA polymerase sigma factor [Haliangiales bacterium]|nr:sigma-70 family RNA polymerase sigma factor [Haliangiales bacterium]
MSLLDEERLIARAQAGEVEALRPLLTRFSDPLYATVILPRMGSAASAEDVLRDTLATAVEKIGTFRWEGRSFYGWLRQIALNKVIDVHRRARRAGRAMAALAHEVERETPPSARADEQLIAAEERRRNAARIREVLAGMAPRYREAIELRLVQELPREECARRLDISLGNFDVLLYRAIRAFRKEWDG